MSFQLIHTSYPHLLDSSASGYGTVARTENMPRALITRLTALSVMREPRWGCCARGPQFSYRIVDLGGNAWHVLSCVQSAGADYSGRACHTAHHLVLSQQEVEELMKDAARPTPAGITLALQRSGFWLQKWQGEPRYIIGEPPVQPDSLPDATAQPTWKHITGHKSNARAFYTAPYNRECLITLPADTPSGEVLGLFHESDWLTHTLGWGMTYTTEADEADSFAETLRMVTAAHSPLIQRAARTGHPVLHITSDMELPMEPATSGNAPQTSPAASGNDFRVLPRSLSHYHYTEEPDWLQYDVPMPGSNPYVLPLAALGSILVLAGVTIGIGVGISRSVNLLDEQASPDTYEEAPAEVQITGVQKLENLLRAPYDHEATAAVLDELRKLQENAPEDTLLIECAVHIANAQKEGANHPAVLVRLAECARLLGLKEEALGRLYLLEATREITPDAWHHQPALMSAAEWEALSREMPLMYHLFSSVPELKLYSPGSYEIQPTPTTELATAEKLTPPSSTESGAEEKPQQVIGSHPAVRGKSVPSALINALSDKPLTIKSGYFCVAELQKGDKLRSARRLQLHPDGYQLTIYPTDKKGVFSLEARHKDGKPADFPAVTIRIGKNKIQEIKSQGNEAVVSFPVPVSEHTLTNIILAPKIAIPLPAEKAKSLPSVREMGHFGVTADNLVVSAPKGKDEVYTVQLKNRGKKFPWKQEKEQVIRIEFEVHLPALVKENSIARGQSASPRLKWKEAKVVNEDEKTTQIHCVVEHRPLFPDCLDEELERVGNSPCCGMFNSGNKEMNLAHLLYIGKRLKETRNQDERNSLFQSYVKMLEHPQFGDILRRMLGEESGLTLPKKVRKEYDFQEDLKEQLILYKGYERIIECVCATIRGALAQNAYKQEIMSFDAETKKKHSLILHDLTQGEGGELLWHFRLESEK